jgi:DNA-binding MarR family transcriptional regulator
MEEPACACLAKRTGEISCLDKYCLDNKPSPPLSQAVIPSFHPVSAVAEKAPVPEVVEPSRVVGRLIKLVFASLVRNIDERMQPLGLTAMQWEPLMLIHVARADTVAGLARESQVNCASMTRMLDRLEAKELLRRRRSSADRRVVHVELTSKGRKVVSAILPKVVSTLDEHLEGFTASDVSRLTNLLERMLANGQRSGGTDQSTHD